MDYSQESLKLHKERRGKVEIRSKFSLVTREDLSVAYTPGVAAVSSLLAKEPEKAYEYSSKGNTIAVVSDGSAVLGLGNIGPYGALPVMEGKAILFKEFAGVDAIPIVLNTQDTEEIVRTVINIAPTFCGINLEDISAPRCFEIEERLKNVLDIPVFHDDQHGTAIVVLAGLINALKVVKKDAKEIKVVINGAGAAGTAIARLLKFYGIEKLVVLDTKGAITNQRTDLNFAKKELLSYVGDSQSGTLKDVMKNADVFIGVSAAGTLTAEMISSMNTEPVIFAMANPIPEIMPEVAKGAGAMVVATGRSDYPNQINNVLVFPGLFRGLINGKVRQVTDEIKVRAAEAIASMITSPEPDCIIPSPLNREVAKVVADSVRIPETVT